MLALWEKSYGQPRQHIKKQRHYFATKVHLVKAMVFPVVMYGCESWTIKKAEHWCFWTVVLKKTLESSLECKKIKPVNPKGNQSWIFIGVIDAKLKLQYFVHLMWRTDSLEKTLMLRNTEDQEEKGMTEDEMVGCHHWLVGHEFEQALGVGDGQRGLVCCSPWGQKKWDTTEWLNWYFSFKLYSLSFCPHHSYYIVKILCKWDL